MPKHAKPTKRPIRHPKLRQVLYATVIALLCAAPVAGFIRMAPDEFLDTMACLAIAGDHRRMFGYALAAAAFVCIWLLMYVVLAKLPEWMDRWDRWTPPRALGLRFTRRSVLVTAAIIIACWIPAIIMLFPGTTTTYDTINQIYQFFSDAPNWYSATSTVVDASFIDHHPWFDTLIFGGFIWIGRSLGSDAAGLFAYCLIQTLLTALVMSAAVCYLERLKVPPAIRIALLAFVILFPVFPISAMTMQKDSLFSIVFVVYVLMYFELFRTRGAAFKSRRFLIWFAIDIALCILTKKTGVYIVGLSTLVLIIAVKGVRLRSLLTMAAPAAVCMALLPAIVFPALDIMPGGSQEVWGILYQQSVTVLKEAPKSVTDEQRAAIDKIIDVEAAVAAYNPTKTDNVKRQVREDVSTKDKQAYLAVWLDQGLKHPAMYVKSILQCCAPLLVPSTSIGLNTKVGTTGIKYFAEHEAEIGGEFHLDIANPPETQAAAKAAYGFYGTLCRMPVTSLFCTMGFYDCWIPLIALAVALYSRRRRDMCALAPIIISALILIASPAALSRYAISLIFLAVPAIGWAIYCLRRRRS